MCGRFILISSPGDLAPVFGAEGGKVQAQARYNIAPTQQTVVVTQRSGRQLELFRWGLIPHWAKDLSIGTRMINARAETVHQKPAFKQALALRRCLVPADGFYEWDQAGKPKTPHLFTLCTRTPMAFAGLWETWHPPLSDPIDSFTIITTQANALLAKVHDRMPVILPPERYAAWLDPACSDPGNLLPLLKPFPAEEMIGLAVSTRVNSPANDGPELLEPAG